MALKSAQQEPVKAEVIEDALDTVDTTLDRVKVLYEQYFLGIQKQPPQYLHADVERKLRDLAQLQIRNTALRYRFATLQQKFGSYNTYWRRTLRQIEAGKYHRNLSKIGRQAAVTGAEIPEEILAAMPKRMREQVRRDREAALALQRRRDGGIDDAELLTLVPLDDEAGASSAREPVAPRRGFSSPGSGGTHVLDESDADLDLDAYFKSIQDDGPGPGDEDDDEPSTALVPRRSATVSPSPPPAPPAPPAPPPSAPPAVPSARPARSPTSAGVTPVPPAVPPQRPGSQPAASRTTTNRHPSTQIATPVPPPPAPPAGAPRPGPLRPPTDPVSAPPGSAGASRQVPAVPPPIPSPPGIRPVPPVSHPISRPPIPGSLHPAVPPATGTPRPISPPAIPGARGRSAEVSGPELEVEESTLHPAQPTPGTRTTPPRLAASFETRPGFGPSRSPSNPGPLVDLHPAVSPGSPLAGSPPPIAPSQSARPNPIAPGSSAARPPAPVESMSGPFPRETPPRPSTPAPRPKSSPRSAPEPRPPPPPGMTDADVNALYAKYVKAKELVGETADPSTYGKLLKTINAQAPKIMEQYQAKGVDFSVVVKDNQVIIRAKPKT